MSNPILTGEQLLANLVNAANPTHKQWLAEELIFGVPQSQVGDFNTTISVTAVDTNGFSGTRQLSYLRVDLAGASQSLPEELELNGEQNTLQIAARLRELYKVNLEDVDVIDEELPLGDGGVITQVIKAAPGSLKWIGQITIMLSPRVIPLEEVIVVTELNGLSLAQLAIP